MTMPDCKIVALEYFKPPFKYSSSGQTIYCEGAQGKQQMCLQIRGWGGLIGTGMAYALLHEKAAHVQDEFGQWVADVMNAALQPKDSTDE